VLAGLGLAHAPQWLFAPTLAAGTVRAVRAVLQAYQPESLALSRVPPAGRRRATKVRVPMDFLAEILA
jgi:DNA-binding transcriptional LysR family regulator